MKATEEQKAARRKKYKKATKEEKSNYAKYQKENYKNISASLKRPEAEEVARIFSAHNVTPAQVIRGAAFALMNGETIPTRSEPLPIPEPTNDQTAESVNQSDATTPKG